jgi:putative ABC transport system permease protein
MILKTAWKNVWRNRTRSLVVIASVTTGVFAAVFSVAFMEGMINQRFDAAIGQEISHIQVTGKGFRLNNDPAITLNDPEHTASVIRSLNGVEGFVFRTIAAGMASTATKSTGVEITGIDPEGEKKIFSLSNTILEGTGDYFETGSRIDPVLIGQDLAKELNIIRFMIDSSVLAALERQVPAAVVDKIRPLSQQRFSSEKKFNRTVREVLTGKETRYFGIIKKEAWSFREGSRMTLTFLDRDNNQVDARFRVAGIYDTKNGIFEMNTVFVRLQDLARLAGLDSNSFHKAIVRIDDTDDTEIVASELQNQLPGAEVMTWKELQPDLAMMADYVHQIYFILMAIIMAALAFGIVNTMLMAVLERTRELGMLAAIGMNRRKIFSMIMFESVFLSAVGGFLGMLVAWLAVVFTARNGINLAQYAEGMEAWGYSAHIYPGISTSYFFMMTALVIITGIVSSIYPAMKALKLNPVEAIRTE